MFGSTQFLITGGTGFIGRHVVTKLLAQGARVRLFCRAPDRARQLFGDGVEIVRGDLRDASTIPLAMHGCDVVIHLGAVFQFGRGARRVLEDTNVRGTQCLLDAATTEGVDRFVHVSSSGVLSGDGTLMTERDFPNHISIREPYRRSKWLGELAALEAARRGLPVTIASPTSPLGAGDEAPTPTGRIVLDYLRGQFPFAARVGLNFIDVNDLADGILAVTTRGHTGERYVLGHHNVWLGDFLQLLARETDGPIPRFTLPQPIIDLAGLLGEWSGSERLCRETAAHAARRQWFDCSKAELELGWRAGRPLDAIARETTAWFQDRMTVNPERILAESDVAAS